MDAKFGAYRFGLPACSKTRRLSMALMQTPRGTGGIALTWSSMTIILLSRSTRNLCSPPLTKPAWTMVVSGSGQKKITLFWSDRNSRPSSQGGALQP